MRLARIGIMTLDVKRLIPVGAAILAACGGNLGSSSGDAGAGASGVGGRGGSSGAGGSSGSGLNPDSGPECFGGPWSGPACGTKLCGNGKVDTCNDCPDGGPSCETRSEECDGILPASVTCASLGFPGGVVAPECAADCTYETAGCDRCAAPGGHLLACRGALAQSSYGGAIALDVVATAKGIGVAWMESNSRWFSLLAPDLSVIKSTALPVGGCFSSIAVATRPGGWEVALSDSSFGVQLVALGDAGQFVTSTELSATGHGAVFAERAGGNPLVAWIEPGPNGLRAAVVAGDGTSTTSPTSLATPGGTADDFVSAAFTGSAFLVAVRAGTRVVVGRVEGDGTSTGATTTPVPDLTEVPALAGASGEARLVYESSGGNPTVQLVRLDPYGKALEAPVTLGAAPDYYNNAYAVAVGSDTLVVMGDDTGIVDHAARLDVVRVDAAGNTVWGPVTAATDPFQMTHYRAVPAGSGVVAAFLDSSYGIGVARIQP